MRSGALGISTSRTLGHVVPDGRPVPGTWAGPDELLAVGAVLARTGRGLFEGAMRLGERDDEALTSTRAEVAVMGEISRRSGRPVSSGLVHSNRRPDLYTRVIEFTREENAHARAERAIRSRGPVLPPSSPSQPASGGTTSRNATATSTSAQPIPSSSPRAARDIDA